MDLWKTSKAPRRTVNKTASVMVVYPCCTPRSRSAWERSPFALFPRTGASIYRTKAHQHSSNDVVDSLLTLILASSFLRTFLGSSPAAMKAASSSAVYDSDLASSFLILNSSRSAVHQSCVN